MYTYDTLSEAINGLKARGYNLDFNLTENCLECEGMNFHPEDFEIVEIHRFEGMTNPSDASVLYAIESKKGDKGTLVTGYGIYADSLSAEMAKKLSIHLALN